MLTILYLLKCVCVLLVVAIGVECVCVFWCKWCVPCVWFEIMRPMTIYVCVNRIPRVRS